MWKPGENYFRDVIGHQWQSLVWSVFLPWDNSNVGTCQDTSSPRKESSSNTNHVLCFCMTDTNPVWNIVMQQLYLRPLCDLHLSIWLFWSTYFSWNEGKPHRQVHSHVHVMWWWLWIHTCDKTDSHALAHAWFLFAALSRNDQKKLCSHFAWRWSLFRKCMLHFFFKVWFLPPPAKYASQYKIYIYLPPLKRYYANKLLLLYSKVQEKCDTGIIDTNVRTCENK